MHAAAQLSSHAESCPGQDQEKVPPTVDGFPSSADGTEIIRHGYAQRGSSLM